MLNNLGIFQYFCPTLPLRCQQRTHLLEIIEISSETTLKASVTKKMTWVCSVMTSEVPICKFDCIHLNQAEKHQQIQRNFFDKFCKLSVLFGFECAKLF